MIKDAIWLTVGIGCAAFGWLLLIRWPLRLDGEVAFSSGGMALFVGLTLIVFAIADWRYRRRNAQGS